jgi:hypothetical protein
LEFSPFLGTGLPNRRGSSSTPNVFRPYYTTWV